MASNVVEDFVIELLTALTGDLMPGSATATVLVRHGGRALFGALRERELDLAGLAGGALFRVLGRGRDAEQQRRTDALAATSSAEAWAIAEPYVRNSGLDEDDQELVLRYISAVPNSCRRALHRWNDGDRVTTLISELPRSPEDAIRFAPARPPRFRPGHRIPGSDLKLDMFLGQGSFGEVWRARNTEVPGYPPVALKFCLEPDLLPSLRREIELLSRLEGADAEKDFVRLLYTAYSAEPPFLVYEYMDGGDLEGWMKSFGDAAPSVRDVVSVLKMIARAVHFAHERNVVHCDLKPSNLLVTSQGRVKIADFGVGHVTAALQRRSVAAHHTQRFGGRALTPMYADDLRDPRLPPDPKDDVYAIGVIGFQLLVGRVVRLGGGWREHLESRDVPEGLVNAIHHCLLPRKTRFRDAGALLAALEQQSAERAPEPASESELAPEAERGRFCHRCGRAAPAGLRFCTYCGYRHPGP